MITRTRTALITSIAGLAMVLAGCSSQGTSGSNPEQNSESASSAETITIEDAWVKAAEEGMTGAFGILTNSRSDEVNVVGVTTPAAAKAELHETVENDAGEMVMQPIEGGFVIPAGGSFSLEPGGNHLMLMELTGPLAPGEEIPFTLQFSDGSTLDFSAVVKDYSGANENYVGDDMDMEMDGDQ